MLVSRLPGKGKVRGTVTDSDPILSILSVQVKSSDLTAEAAEDRGGYILGRKGNQGGRADQEECSSPLHVALL